MKIVNEFGHETKILDEGDVVNIASNCMYTIFNTMLESYYHINAEEFKEIVKNHFPEKHI